MGVWNNVNTWVIIEWYLHVAGYVFLLIVGVCVVVCMVLVFCAAFKTGVEDVSIMFLCATSWLHVCCFWRWIFKKNYVLHCHGFVLHTCSPVKCILPVHCFVLFWILSYLCVKENVIVWLLIFGRFHVILRGSVWVGFLRHFQILGRAGGFCVWWGFTSVSKILLGEIVTSSFRWLLLVYSV